MCAQISVSCRKGPSDIIAKKHKKVQQYFCRNETCVFFFFLMGIVPVINHREMQMCWDMSVNKVIMWGGRWELLLRFLFWIKTTWVCEFVLRCRPAEGPGKISPACLFTHWQRSSLNQHTAACWHKSSTPKFNQLHMKANRSSPCWANVNLTFTAKLPFYYSFSFFLVQFWEVSFKLWRHLKLKCSVKECMSPGISCQSFKLESCWEVTLM